MMNEINLSLDSCDRQAADIENRLTRLERMNDLTEQEQFTQSPNSSITCVDSHNSDKERNPSIIPWQNTRGFFGKCGLSLSLSNTGTFAPAHRSDVSEKIDSISHNTTP